MEVAKRGALVYLWTGALFFLIFVGMPSLATAPRVAIQTTASPPTDPCACVRTFNLQCEQGQTLSTQISIEINDTPVDVTGGEFQFTAKLDAALPDSDPSTVMVDWSETTAPTTGTTWLQVPADTTQTMQATGYAYQVRFVSVDDVVTPLVKGTLTIIAPISARH
jgi:hypothetical protein